MRQQSGPIGMLENIQMTETLAEMAQQNPAVQEVLGQVMRAVTKAVSLHERKQRAAEEAGELFDDPGQLEALSELRVDGEELAKAYEAANECPERRALAAESDGAPAGWISAQERFPAPGQWVLVMIDSSLHLGCHMDVCRFSHDSWVPHESSSIRNSEQNWEWHLRSVTHWMPLPKPPGDTVGS